MRLSWSTTLRITLVVGLIGAAVGFLSGPIAADDEPTEAAPEAPEPDAPRASADDGTTFPGLDPRRHRVEDGVTVADLSDGSTALLSLDPGLQAHLTGLYEQNEVPFGAAVALDPSTGRVLAYVSHSSADPDAPDQVLDASPPTASVFKIITAAALVDAGVHPGDQTCYHGGVSRLTEDNLDDAPDRDNRCSTLADAMGGSINCVFAKLADRHLDPPTLERFASAFGFGHPLPFDVPTRLSAMEVPTERLEFARTSAGFWHMHMSPLHGALIAATIANDGRMPRPTLVDEVIAGDGDVTYRAEPSIYRDVIPRRHARLVGQMMERTVARGGTARRYFFDRRGNAFLPGIDAAGKTGTLAGSDPYRGYTWFVGYAPVDDPQIAVAALVVNEPRWRIKGAYVAREAMRYWLVTRPREQRQAARDAERAAAEAQQTEAAE